MRWSTFLAVIRKEQCFNQMEKQLKETRENDRRDVRRTLLAVRAKWRQALALSLRRRGPD